MKLNQNFQVIDPIVHDAELIRIDFNHASIALRIKLASDERVMTLLLINPHWFSFTTDHSQNVIDTIMITEDLNDVLVNAPQYIRELPSRRQRGAAMMSSQPEPLKAIIVRPVSGPELKCLADDVIEQKTDP